MGTKTLTFRAPREVALVQTKGTVFLVSTTNSNSVNTTSSKLKAMTKIRLGVPTSNQTLQLAIHHTDNFITLFSRKMVWLN